MVHIGPMKSGSEVVKTLEQASGEAWKRWRRHVDAGTGHSAEAVDAYESARLAGAAWLDELALRAAFSARAAA
jgi:hypothetical protein